MTERPVSSILMTVDEVAERLQFQPETVRTYLRTGKLRGSRFAKTWRISEEALADFIRVSEGR